MNYYLGIDIGTSGTKATLFDSHFHAIATATSGYDMQQPYLGWAEQSPETWWHATQDVIRQVVRQSHIQPENIRSIGVTGQMHGMVLLDAFNQVLRPAIIWCDQRTTEECEWLTTSVGREHLIAITANPALPAFTASKILWVQRHEPEIFHRIDKILLPKDYIVHQLTGGYSTDVSDASGTQLLDIHTRQWSQTMLNVVGIQRHQLPEVYESEQVVGYVQPTIAALLGLSSTTSVVAGAGDQAAAAVGNGIVSPGTLSMTIGSSGVVFAATDQPIIDPHGRVHTFCHAVNGKWHVMGVTQAAGLSMKWMKDQLFQHEVQEAVNHQRNVYDEINRQISLIPAGAEGVIYLPYLNGERTPHLDAHARGVFFGLTTRHTKAHLVRAVMEGVTCSLHDCYGVLQAMQLSAAKIRVAGGGAQSDVWMQMIADHLNIPSVRTNVSDAGTLGCAMLAAVGCGDEPSLVELCNRIVLTSATFTPETTLHHVYMPYYQLYQQLYLALKPQFVQLAEISQQ